MAKSPVIGGDDGSRSGQRAQAESAAAPWDIEIIHLDERAFDEFLPEKALVRQLRVGAAFRRSPGARVLQAALAAAALMGSLYVLPGTWNNVRRQQEPTTSATNEPITIPLAAAAARSSAPAKIAIASAMAAEAEVPEVIARPSNRTNDTGGDVPAPAGGTAPANRIAASAPASSAAPAIDIAIESRPQPTQPSTVRDTENAAHAERIRQASGESPNPLRTLAGQSVAFAAVIPAAVSASVRPPALDVAAADEIGDGARPLASSSPATVEAGLASLDPAPVRDLLAGYQAAYERLDAQLAKRIWPAVDERALARAFDALESQTVTFETCNLSVGGDRAIASCRGSATYVTRMGHRTSRTERRQWTFQLEKLPERWVIGSVRIR